MIMTLIRTTEQKIFIACRNISKNTVTLQVLLQNFKEEFSLIEHFFPFKKTCSLIFHEYNDPICLHSILTIP